MRPFPGDDAFLRRARAASDNEPPTALFNPHAGPQMTFFVGDEAAVDSALRHSSTAFLRSKEARKPHAGQSLSDNADPTSAGPSYHHEHDRGANETRTPSYGSSVEALGEHDGEEEEDMLAPNTPALKLGAVSNISSQPMTPILLGPSGPASAVSSISSRRNSLSASSADLGSHSQALSVDDDGGEVDRGEPSGDSGSMMDSGSAPQLVMPSIKMPSRRPFTEAGKSLGRLKVLIAGDTGVGKTSLVKAVVQSCEHIVHVDPIAPLQTTALVRRATLPKLSSPRGRRQSARPDSGGGTRQISEIYASTKPYPEWWSEMDMDDVHLLKRRKSLGDAVLDRNICFVDTPGYGSGSSSMDTITPVVQYVESHLQRISSNALAEGDTLNMLGGDGGVQVDAVLYLVLNRLRPVDIQYLRQLSPLTNIILLLAQADLMSPEQIAASKEQVWSQLHEAKIRPFSFVMINANSDAVMQGLYAISSATGSDHDTMDASLLMSPDYVQPLIPTELATLVEQVFSPSGASWLRHSAARKYVQWRKQGNGAQPMALYHQPQLMTSSYAQSSYSYHDNRQDGQVLTPAFGAPSSYVVARVTDHAQREERLAQIRLVNWAADLQRSLANERAQYEGLARSERAVWLTEKLNECVQDGMLVPAAVVRGRSSARGGRDGRDRRGWRKTAADHPQGLQHHDPLGLLEVAAGLRQKGLLALELLGGLGVLGGLALWLSKHYGYFQTYEWLIAEWDKFWYGGGR